MLAAAPTGNYALIGGDPGQTGSTQFQEGYHEVLDPLVAAGDVTIVIDYFTPAGRRSRRRPHAENTLTKTNNDVAAFLVTYDGMSWASERGRAAGLEPGSIPVTGQDVELAAAQAIVEGRMFGSVWPAPDEMAKRGAAVAVALAKCEPFDHRPSTTAPGDPLRRDPHLPRRGRGHGRVRLPHRHWWNSIDDVYANVPDGSPPAEATHRRSRP